MTVTDMESRNRIVAENSGLHRLFTLGPSRVSLTGETLHIEGLMGGGPAKIPVGAIDSITVRPSWFWHRLTIRLGDGTERSVGGLDEREAIQVREAVIEGAVRVAKAVSPHLKRLDERFSQYLTGDRYARNGDSRKLYETLAPVLRECKGLTRGRLDQEAAEVVGRLAPLECIEGFETARRRANELFISRTIPTVQAAVLEILRNPLTNEQAGAVATDEDATLVLAGAGTGKTSVIVGKVAHLVRNQDVSPDEGLRDCGDLLGHVEERTLSRTFRFADGILDPSTAFVKRNPEQTQRPLLPASGAEDKGIAIVADSRPAGGVARALQDIESKSRGQQRTVLTLGRYRQRRNEFPAPPRRGSLRVEFSTVHGAKGREADYVMVLDLNDGRWGFPSKVDDDPLLELVLPPASGGGYPFAEERRLFYVAMTRARIGAYLVTDPVHPSTFVTELLRGSYELRQIGDLAPECQRCSRGRLRPSQNLMSLICSDSSCDHRAPRCPSCDAGYALVGERVASCTNQGCRRPPTVCPRCGLGVLRVIDGRFGPFWGCTEYGSKLSCRYKRDFKSDTIRKRT